MFLVAQAAQSAAQSESVFKSIPHDGSAIVVYVLILAFMGVIWAGSRKRS